MSCVAERMPNDAITSPKWTRWRWIWLGVFIGVSCFALLGGHGLLEPDEGRYAEMSREMLASGDWLVPTLHESPHLQKPPIVYWLTSFCLSWFGHNEWAVRLPSAFAAAGTAWLTFIIGRALFSSRAGVAGMLVLLTSLQFFAMAHALTPDMILTFWIAAALASLMCWAEAPDPKPRRWLWGFFTLMGAGFLTKGPMALVVPVSAALTWQIAQRGQGNRVVIPWRRGLTVTLVIGLSWFVVVTVREPKLLHFFLHDELFARVATTHHGRYHAPWFFIPVLLVGLLPWTLLIPSLFGWLTGEWRRQRGLPASWWLLIGWVLWPFLLLSVSGSKLMSYILPLYPAWALAVGAWWDQRGVQRDLTWHSISFIALFVVLTLALAGFSIWTSGEVNLISLPMFFGLIFVLLAWGALLISPSSRPVLRGVTPTVGTLCVFLLFMSKMDAFSDLLGPGASMRRLARRVQSGPAVVFEYGVNAPGLEFYLDRFVYISRGQVDHLLSESEAERKRLLDSPQQCAELAHSGWPVLGVVKRNHVGRDFPTNSWRVIDKAGDFALIQAAETQPAEPGARAKRTWSGSRRPEVP